MHFANQVNKVVILVMVAAHLSWCKVNTSNLEVLYTFSRNELYFTRALQIFLLTIGLFIKITKMKSQVSFYSIHTKHGGDYRALKNLQIAHLRLR